MNHRSSAILRGRVSKLAWTLAFVAILTLNAGAMPCFIVWTNRPPSRNLDGRCSFCFLKGRYYVSSDPLTDRGVWADRVRCAIGTKLEDKGYRLAPGRPDFLVAHHILISYRDYSEIANGVGGYCLTPEQMNEAPPNLVIPTKPELGTLVVDFIDPARKAVVLRTWKQASLVNLMDARTIDREIECVVAAALTPIPRVPAQACPPVYAK